MEPNNSNDEGNTGPNVTILSFILSALSLLVNAGGILAGGILFENRTIQVLCLIFAFALVYLASKPEYFCKNKQEMHRFNKILNNICLLITFFVVFNLFSGGKFPESCCKPSPTPSPSPIPTISNPAGKIAAGDNFSLLLRSDKTVTTYGKVEGIDTSDWENIVQIAAYKDHAIGLCESGRVVVTAANRDEYEVGNWSGIIQVAACYDAVIGVTGYGAVLLEGPCVSNILECSRWENVDRIIAAAEHVVALTKNGRLLVAARKDYGQTNITHIRTAIAGAASNRLTFLVLEGGTVKAIGDPWYDENQVSGWSDMVAVAGGDMFTIGLKRDGTLRSVGDNEYGQRNVGDWTKMIAVCAGKDHTIGLCEDGSVFATGIGTSGQCGINGENYWAGN